jgi:hypothetical protein
MKLLEIYQELVESKGSEARGINLLKKGGVDNPEDIINQFASGDESKNAKNIPVMAYIYATGYNDIKNIIEILNEYNKLEIKKRIKSIQLTKTAINIGDKQFNDFITFSEYIHGETNKYSDKKSGSSVASDFKAEKKPIWSGNNIDIYDGVNVGKCISYTQGALTGRAYAFCIGQPGNTMYKSYRDSKVSSFYFIVDRNRFNKDDDGSVNLDDPLHIVVFDNTEGGIELTDANNNTGTVSEFGENTDGYVNYLKGKGVPVDKMANKPKTSQEDEEERLLGKQNNSLEWFMKLPIKYKSAYIGRGHQLTNDQFDYLIGD